MEIPKGCDYDLVGETSDGFKVEAITDCMGPQVVVGGRKETIHLLSKKLENHEEAIALAQRVVTDGISCYDNWDDLKGIDPGVQFLNVLHSITKPYKEQKSGQEK